MRSNGKGKRWVSEKRTRTSAKKELRPQAASFDTQNHFVTFWGVRGTMPTPRPEFLKYGGNTPCVESHCVPSGLLAPHQTLICDAGSGLISLGEDALLRGVKEFHLLLSHMHYDHMMGLQKFAPLFRTDCHIHIYGLKKGGKSLRDLFAGYFQFPFFPVEFLELPSISKLQFHEINNLKSAVIAGKEVAFFELNHPQQAVAFRVHSEDKSTSFVYATDHEHGTEKDEGLIEFLSGSELFLYDTTFTTETFDKFKGWGHSTAQQGARFAKQGHADHFGLFHHDPEANDTFLETHLLPEAKAEFSKCFLAREGETLELRTLKGQGYEEAKLEGQFFRFTQSNGRQQTG